MSTNLKDCLTEEVFILKVRCLISTSFSSEDLPRYRLGITIGFGVNETHHFCARVDESLLGMNKGPTLPVSLVHGLPLDQGIVTDDGCDRTGFDGTRERNR